MESLYRSLFRDQQRHYLESIKRPASSKINARHKYLLARNLLYKSLETHEAESLEQVSSRIKEDTSRSKTDSNSPLRSHSRSPSNLSPKVISLRRIQSKSPPRNLIKLEKCNSPISLRNSYIHSSSKSNTPASDRFVKIHNLIEKCDHFSANMANQSKAFKNYHKSFSDMAKEYENLRKNTKMMCL
ncbi:unnamed protein product [Blepharisma stoltei]|uniref:Uncharacterized protein n=1 Tax=Blepharisma stoltei TaxID=1481888 RepID=A0AAU9IPI9_9CILI|nr:unnamed protein product [Blepharisma stoltei]